MALILNIGLNLPRGGTLQATTALRAMEAYGLPAQSAALHHSDTEATLVATVRPGQVPPGKCATVQVRKLAHALGQDCIAAYWDRERTGALLGPRAAAWGEFNPEFFILPGGHRLAAPAVPHAVGA